MTSLIVAFQSIVAAGALLINIEESDIPNASDDLKKALEGLAAAGEESKKAWSDLEKLADAGDANAQFALGLATEQGKRPDPAREVTEKWYRKAADQGHVAAAQALGQYLINSADPGEHDRIARGVKSLEKAAGLGSLKAIRGLGALFAAGGPVEQNVATARSWLDKGVALKDARSMYLTAMIYAGVYKNLDLDHDQAIEWLKKASDAGYAPADMRMAYRHEVGYGVERDLAKARTWYEKAAKLGSGEASFRLGTMFESGYGVEKDLKQAFRCFSEAAKNDFVEAHNKLGNYYESGQGVEAKDEKKALEQYTSAAQAGSALGMYNLSVFYAKGKVVKKDPVTSFRWMLDAAMTGLPEAQHEVAFRYAGGLGVARDYVAAAAWYGRSATANHVPSQMALASLYEQGLGVQRSIRSAAHLYNMAGKLGNPVAQTRLGEILERGLGGMEEDLVKAYVLYSRAAAREHKPALERRDFLYKVLTKTQREEAIAILEADKATESSLLKPPGSAKGAKAAEGGD